MTKQPPDSRPSHWVVTRLTNTLGQHAEDWDRLNREQNDTHPLLRSSLINGHLQNFGTNNEYLCRRQTASNLLSMLILRYRGMGVWTTFNPPVAQICPAVGRNHDDFHALFSALPKLALEIDLLSIDPVVCNVHPSDSFCIEKPHALTMSIAGQNNFETYWGNRSKKLRSNLQRYEKRVEAAGLAIEFKILAAEEDVDASIDRYAELESQGWKSKTGTALTAGSRQTKFFRHVLCAYSKHSQARAYELWLDGKLAASRLAISSESMTVMLKTSYLESLSNYSPGRLLLKLTLQDQLNQHPNIPIEFYTNASTDQLAWSTAQRYILHKIITKNKTNYRILEFGRRFMRAFRSKPINLRRNTLADLSIETYRHPNQLPPDVDKLFLEKEKVDIELGASWLKNLIDSVYQHPNKASAAIYVLRDEQQIPVAVLPLLFTSSSKSKKSAGGLANFYTSLYEPILSPELTVDQLAFLLKQIIRENGRASEWRFSPLEMHGRGIKMLSDALRHAGLPAFRFFCHGNWFLEAPPTWNEYLASRSANLRSTLKRGYKKFTADRGEIEIYTSSSNIQAAIADFESVYENSWKNKEPYPDFIPGLITLCAQNGWLRLGIARIENNPIAAQLWITSNRKAKIYKVAYKSDYKQYSIGHLLTAELAKFSIENDHVSEIDFLIGDDAYKKIWMNERRERWGIIAFDPKTFTGLYNLCKEAVWRNIKPYVNLVRQRSFSSSMRAGDSHGN